MKDVSYVSEARTLFAAALVIFCFFTGIVVYNSVQEFAYVTAQAFKPMKPKLVKPVYWRPAPTFESYKFPNQRVYEAFCSYGQGCDIPKPRYNWASARMDG